MDNRKHIFTQLEKKTFIDLLKKYSNIVENKHTDGASLKEKKRAWHTITREYNASPNATTQVTHKQMRRLWMNLKQRQRGALIKERQHRLATGGGPSTSDTVIDPDVSQVAPALTVGIEDAIDSDTKPGSVEIHLVGVGSEDLVTEPMEARPATARSYIPTPTPPPTTPTPPPESSSAATLPPVNIPMHPENSMSFQRHKNSILDKEYRDRKQRANEVHELDILLLKEKVREAKAKADLAELLLQQQQQLLGPVLIKRSQL